MGFQAGAGPASTNRFSRGSTLRLLFAIVFAGQYPAGLRGLALYYLRWCVRAAAYFTLLRDKYPPFGDAEYPASLQFEAPVGARGRLSVAFRIILLIPQFIAVGLIGVAWAITTILACTTSIRRSR
jgi:hypothetical protein